jgi:hypothetical protein
MAVASFLVVSAPLYHSPPEKSVEAAKQARENRDLYEGSAGNLPAAPRRRMVFCGQIARATKNSTNPDLPELFWIINV